MPADVETAWTEVPAGLLANALESNIWGTRGSYSGFSAPVPERGARVGTGVGRVIEHRAVWPDGDDVAYAASYETARIGTTE